MNLDQKKYNNETSQINEDKDTLIFNTKNSLSYLNNSLSKEVKEISFLTNSDRIEYLASACSKENTTKVCNILDNFLV